MANIETFQHELSPREYAVLIDAQFQAAALAMPNRVLDKVPLGVPNEDYRNLYRDEHDDVTYSLAVYNIGERLLEDDTSRQPWARKPTRKMARLVAYAIGENVDTGFAQDVQLVGIPSVGVSYEVLDATTAEDLRDSPVSLDNLLRIVSHATSRYVAVVTHDSFVWPYYPAQEAHEAPIEILEPLAELDLAA